VRRGAGAAAVRASALAVGDVGLVVGGVEIFAIPAAGCDVRRWKRGSLGRDGLRGEDEGLADEFALGVLGNGNGVTSGTRSATDKCALGGGGPASVADVGELDFAVVGVCSRADEHAEALLEGGRLAAGDIVDV
jgi:hypothetical protein